MTILQLGYTILRPCGYLYGIASFIGILASYIGAHNQSYITSVITSPYPAFIPLLIWSTISGTCAAIRGLLFTQLNQTMYAHLSISIFDRLRSATMETWDIEWNESELTKTIMTDLYDVIQSVSLLCNVCLRTITTILCSSYLWYHLSPTFFYIGLMVSLVHVIAFHIVQPWSQQRADTSRIQKQAAETCMNEYVQKHTSIMLYDWCNYYQTNYIRIMTNYQIATRAESYSYAILLLTTQLLPRLGEVSLLLFFINKGVQFPILFEMIAYYHMITDSVNACKDQLISTYKQRNAMERIWSILQKPCLRLPREIIRNCKDPPTIHINNITFRYPTSSISIFKNYSLIIHPGEFIILSAESGRGKSTLVKLIMGLYPLETGTITPPNISSYISIVPQDAWYDPQRTVKENIQMGTTMDVLDMLERVHLSEWKDRLDRPLINLSGGQKQRLAIARILLCNTPIVILDEPTSSLDKSTEKEIIELLMEQCKEKTVLWITHHADAIPKDPRIRFVYL